ncbi:MAG: hypothetical protein ACI3X1_07640 [Eubacteriales bacterium]
MNDKIFRKKSIDRMSSPEQLNDYIKVTNPGVWMVLSAIVILLIGVCVWGVFGKLETKLTVAAVSQDGQTVLYVKEDNLSSVKENMSVYIGDETYKVTSVSAQPVAVSEGISEYALHLGNLQIGEWVYIVQINGNIPDGAYKAQIVTDSVSPLYFVFN